MLSSSQRRPPISRYPKRWLITCWIWLNAAKNALLQLAVKKNRKGFINLWTAQITSVLFLTSIWSMFHFIVQRNALYTSKWILLHTPTFHSQSTIIATRSMPAVHTSQRLMHLQFSQGRHLRKGVSRSKLLVPVDRQDSELSIRIK